MQRAAVLCIRLPDAHLNIWYRACSEAPLKNDAAVILAMVAEANRTRILPKIQATIPLLHADITGAVRA
jgi:hypothetical protein